MCIAVILKPKIKISRTTFDICWDNNPHGGGYMFDGDGKINIVKGFMDKDEFFNSYIIDRTRYNASTFVLHFRYQSVGTISEENTHPFEVGRDKAMVHNGTIYGLGDDDSSDTSVLARDILSFLPQDFTERPVFDDLIESYIGRGRVAVLDSIGKLKLYNEKSWVKDSNIIYSNDGYKSVVDRTKKDYTYSNNSYVSNYKGYSTTSYQRSWWEDSDACEYCGRALLTRGEKTNQCCDKCFNTYIGQGV